MDAATDTRPLAAIKQEVALGRLVSCNGNRFRAARSLRVTYSTLRKWVAAWGLQDVYDFRPALAAVRAATTVQTWPLADPVAADLAAGGGADADLLGARLAETSRTVAGQVAEADRLVADVRAGVPGASAA
jgi:hypothetical protein